jgi:NAD(P)-dependent dehydrogenase (short-subunit alcohol dehydrogenase family)
MSAIYSSLENTVVFVSGGASGIGAAIVGAMIEQKARFAIWMQMPPPYCANAIHLHCAHGLCAAIFATCTPTSARSTRPPKWLAQYAYW